MAVDVLGDGGDGGDGSRRESEFAALAGVRAGSELRVVSPPRTKEGATQPPPHLREADLLALMEQHCIGTDASMATHVSNVIRRGYVVLDEATRRLTPAPLGLALVHAYALIDEGLALPCVRASIEAACGRIAKGEASYQSVVDETT